MKIKIDMMMEQRLFMKIANDKNQKIDFFQLADLLGYEPEDQQAFFSQTSGP